MTTERTPVQVLADAIRERRSELGMTQPDLYERSKKVDPRRLNPGAKKLGRSVRVWSNLECGRGHVPHPRTMLLVDLTLGWDPGTTHAILTTGEMPVQSGEAPSPNEWSQRAAVEPHPQPSPLDQRHEIGRALLELAGQYLKK